MPQCLRDLIADVEGVRGQVSKGKSIQVSSRKQRKVLQQLVDSDAGLARMLTQTNEKKPPQEEAIQCEEEADSIRNL